MWAGHLAIGADRITIEAGHLASEADHVTIGPTTLLARPAISLFGPTAIGADRITIWAARIARHPFANPLFRVRAHIERVLKSLSYKKRCQPREGCAAR